MSIENADGTHLSGPLRLQRGDHLPAVPPVNPEVGTDGHKRAAA